MLARMAITDDGICRTDAGIALTDAGTITTEDLTTTIVSVEPILYHVDIDPVAVMSRNDNKDANQWT